MFEYSVQIDEAMLQGLVDDESRETRLLEFKQSLPGPEQSEKIKFLKAVSSFANASGGTLVYGITEDRSRGVAGELTGLDIANVAQEVRALDASIRTGIEPRLHGVKVEGVPLRSGRHAVVVRVQRSWNSPHRVTLGGHDKFYARNSAGAHPMDVSELKAAFLGAEGAAERLRNFRLERISQVFAEEAPVPMAPGPKLVLHLLPSSALSSGQTYDISETGHHGPMIQPMGGVSGWNSRYTLEGYLCRRLAAEGQARLFQRCGTLAAFHTH